MSKHDNEAYIPTKMQALHEDLQEAIRIGSALQILNLLDINLDPANKDSEGNTVLHHILSNENLPGKMVARILDIFLDDGIDPNTENSRGETALHLAVAKRMNDAIDLLIKYNATINAAGRWFITHYFVEYECKKFWQISNKNKREIAEIQTATFVDWLISRGFDFHLKDDETEGSAFNLAEEQCLFHVTTSVLKNVAKEIKLNTYIEYRKQNLFEGRILISKWRQLRNPPQRSWYLDYKLRHLTNIVKILLDVDGSEKARFLLLKLALTSHELSVVGILTNHFPRSCNERKFATKMFYRVMTHLDVTSYSSAEMKILSDLISRGANVNTKDTPGRVPLYWAVDAKNIQVIKLLKDNGANFQAVDRANSNLLHVLAKGAQVGFQEEIDNVLDFLVAEGVKLNAKNKRGDTPLQIAVTDMNWTAARGLIFHGAAVDGVTGDERKFCDQCLQEIGMLKDTFVDGRTSLYRMMHMHPHERYIYANNETLKTIVESPLLNVKFGSYSRRILSGYNEAKERHSLVERAKAVWLEDTDIELPDECIERIFVYLRNQDLNTFISS